MSSLLKSTSVLVSLPTLLYVGLAQRKNRLDLLENIQTPDITKLTNFLSLPYEFLPFFISMGYGVSFHIYKFLNTEDSDNIDDNGHIHISIEITYMELMCGFIRELNVGGEQITIIKDRFFNTNEEKLYKIRNDINMIVSYTLIYNKTDDIFAKYHKLFKKIFDV